MATKISKWRPKRNIDKPSGYTNAQRAEHGEKAMVGYAVTDDSSDFRDLLTDLMHYAQREKVDFDAELAMARNLYEEER